MPVVQKTSRTAYKSGNLSIDSPLKSDRQPLKIDNESTGILLSTDRVYLQNEPLSEKEVIKLVKSSLYSFKRVSLYVSLNLETNVLYVSTSTVFKLSSLIA